jgi:(p)ppGpp synthase/HD superfamily hydrolase
MKQFKVNEVLRASDEPVEFANVLPDPEILESIDVGELSLLMTPLSGITHKDGVAGLKNRLMIEIKGFDHSSIEKISSALVVANLLFDGIEYKQMPYTTHLLRVAIRLIRDYDVRDPDTVVAALLHDSIEDVSERIVEIYGNESDTAETVLERMFGAEVSSTVRGLSNTVKPKGLSQLEKNKFYQNDVRDKLHKSYRIFLIKLSDFTDNGLGLHWGEDPVKTSKVAVKYLPVVQVFLDAIDHYEESGEMSSEIAEFARKKLIKSRPKIQSFADLAASA